MAKTKQRIIYVTDTETTGGAPPQAAICEIAAVPVTTSGVIMLDSLISSLVNPGHPIPPETRAVHHISDADVKNAPDIKAVMKSKFGKADLSLVAAHNMPFDMQFLEPHLPDKVDALCTYRCARHLYPDAPNFKNQTLRYYLNEEPPKAALKGLAPHRAAYDAICTAYILARMIRDAGFDELLRLTGAPVIMKTIPFGKHRGMQFDQVPRDYLQWVCGQADMDADVKHTAKHYLLNAGRRPAQAAAH